MDASTVAWELVFLIFVGVSGSLFILVAGDRVSAILHTQSSLGHIVENCSESLKRVEIVVKFLKNDISQFETSLYRQLFGACQ